MHKVHHTIAPAQRVDLIFLFPFRCERPHGLCREIVCGLKLYEDVDEVLFTNLVEAIKRVQESGSLVKLSFGGWAEYGNLRVPTKVVCCCTFKITTLLQFFSRL